MSASKDHPAASAAWDKVRAALLPPLRFASANDFAAADRLRGFSPLVSRVMGEHGPAIDDATTRKLRALTKDFDQTEGQLRRERVREFLALLNQDAAHAATPTTERAPKLAVPSEAPAEPPASARAKKTAAKGKAAKKAPAKKSEGEDAAAQSRAKKAPSKKTPAKKTPTKKTRAKAPAKSGRASDPPPPAKEAERRTPITIPEAVARTRAPLARPVDEKTAQNVRDLFALPVERLSGVGPRRAESLRERNLGTVGDLLLLLPRTYEDRRRPGALRDLEAGTMAVAAGTVAAAAQMGHGRGARFELVVDDGSARIKLVFFRFRAQEMRARYAVGTKVCAIGEVARYRGGLQIVHPRMVHGSGGDVDGVWPVYPEVKGMHPQEVGRTVGAAVDLLRAAPPRDLLPAPIRDRAKVVGLNDALLALHRPAKDLDEEEVVAMRERRSAAHVRLAFEELFVLQLAMAMKQRNGKKERAPKIEGDAPTALADRFLPFALTGAQLRASTEIFKDLDEGAPMGRLLQGDVGAGKTAVAALAAARVAFAGYQAAIMAPTEILAEQHATTFRKWLTPLGKRAELLTGSVPKKARRLLLAKLKNGEIDVLVGTHALVTDDVEFRRLALCVIDEQHRFGVQQRALLNAKGPHDDEGQLRPHLLAMTATPIPRSLALTVYGDLTVSVLDELPPGRTPVATKALTANQHEKAWEVVRHALDRGERAYVVYPLIEESEKLDLEDATRGYDDLCERFGEENVGLLHGRMKPAEKDAVMGRFSAGEISVLVSTTVIEVGVDVPEATCMVVVHAERFGLSQLHQLRGRVGRSSLKSRCLLLVGGDGAGRDAIRRLRVLEDSNDGFKISEEDLLIRGPGDFLGTRQSGLPTLLFSDLARHGQLITLAKELAKEVVAKDGTLSAPEHRDLKLLVEERFKDRLELTAAG